MSMFKSFLTGIQGQEAPADERTPEPTLADVDPYYAGHEVASDAADAAGREDEQKHHHGGTPPVDTAAALSEIRAQMEMMDKRLRDKDRHIHQLEGENRSLSSLITSNQAGVGQPPAQPDEADAPFLDEDTKAILAKRLQEDPADAISALVEYADARSQRRIQAEIEKINAANQSRESAAKVQSNFMNQLQSAVNDFGADAGNMITEMMQSANPRETKLGAILAADRSLVQTQTGVYNAIQGLVLRERASNPAPPAEGSQPPQSYQPGVGVPAPQDHGRTVGRREAEGPSHDDMIGDAITNARGGSSDARLRNLFS